jgi:hypothetical protein
VTIPCHRRIAKSSFECSDEPESLARLSAQVVGSGSDRQVFR